MDPVPSAKIQPQKEDAPKPALMEMERKSKKVEHKKKKASHKKKTKKGRKKAAPHKKESRDLSGELSSSITEEPIVVTHESKKEREAPAAPASVAPIQSLT